MLGRLKEFACRVDSPILILLTHDWRVSVALFVVILTTAFGLTFTLKIWKRSPVDYPVEFRASALDLLQVWSLTRSAHQHETRGDLSEAISAWAAALENDPFNESVAASYLRALNRSANKDDSPKALRVSAWFRNFSTNAEILNLSVIAAENSKDWRSVLQFTKAPNAPALDANARLSRLKALFWTGDFRAAREYLEEVKPSQPSAVRDFYSQAIECVASESPPRDLAFDRLSSLVHLSPPSVEELEVFIRVCFELRDLPRFRKNLALLRGQTDRTLSFELLHSRLLADNGMRTEARAVASQLSAPNSGQETVRTANALLKLGFKAEALDFLQSYREKFSDAIGPWTLSAQLAFEAGDKDQLRFLANKLRRSVPPLNILAASIELCAEPTLRNSKQLELLLAETPRSQYTLIWYFAVQALIFSGSAETALDFLLRIEPFHLADVEFYDKLFTTAEANKNAELMRRAAKRRYDLAPEDLFSMSNYAAMLTIFDSEPEIAANLTAKCASAQPESTSANINHAAALINAERFGSADLILRKIDESSLPPPAQNQLRFIKTKRAVKLGNKTESRSLAMTLDKSALYSRQRQWLAENGL